MINIDGRLINPAHIVSAEVETRHYANGSSLTLVVKLANGDRVRRDHGYGFDAFETLKKIEDATA